MAISRRSSLFFLLALAAVLSACESSTAPDSVVDFDSEAALEAYETMDSLFASPGFAAFEALAGRTPFSASSAAHGALAAVDAAAALGRTTTVDGAQAFAVTLASRLAGIGAATLGPAASPIISDLHRGVTFAYDPEIDRYTQDPERDDAPETGVRLVLYEVDLFGTPIVEEEVGYVDLVDEGDDSAEDVALHLTVFAYETTILDYRTTLDILPTGGTLGVHGFLQEPGGPSLDFDIDATSTRVGEGDPVLDVAFDLSVEARDFSITGTVGGVEDGEDEGTVDLVVRHGDDSIRLDVEEDAGAIDGSVFVNGSVFATVSGDASDPVIASATGEPLTLGELLVLRHIVDGVEDIFDFLEDLLDPVDELIILAILL